MHFINRPLDPVQSSNVVGSLIKRVNAADVTVKSEQYAVSADAVTGTYYPLIFFPHCVHCGECGLRRVHVGRQEVYFKV